MPDTHDTALLQFASRSASKAAVSAAALAGLLSATLLAGCATGANPTDQVGSASTAVAGAVTSPLSDLNIVHADIPAVLKAAAKAPYGPAADGSCTGLSADVQALDTALGPDVDTPAPASQQGLAERGAETAGGAALGAIQSAAEGVVPFRGWVRKLSGAERYSRQVAAAIAAGSIRRAYLKGLGKAAGCEAPAAPRQ